MPAIEPVYDGKENNRRCMNVAWFFSGGASSAAYCSERRCSRDSANYNNVVFATNNPEASGIEAVKRLNPAAEIKVFPHEKIREEKGGEWRKFYYDALQGKLSGYQPDIIACSGWMLIIDGDILDEYKNRILNVHPARLSIVYGHGTRDLGSLGTGDAEMQMASQGLKRKYTGSDAVFGAICDGEHETYSTIHFIDKGEDSGPILLESEPLAVADEMERYQYVLKHGDIGTSDWTGALAKIRNYAKAHQNRQKLECDGPAFHSALEKFVGRGLIGFGEDGRTVYFRKEPMSYSWYAVPYGGLTRTNS